MRKALFLDRDGVINIEKNFVHKKEDFEFVEGIFELVSLANKLGYLVVVVTNQAGIGRGYYSEEDFHALMSWVATEFDKRGSRIDRVYYCPYHPDLGVGEYRRNSDDRKPSPGMLLKAAAELGIDLKNSIMVGDRLSDMEAAVSANVPFRFCLGNCKNIELAIEIRSLNDVIKFIKRDGRFKSGSL